MGSNRLPQRLTVSTLTVVLIIVFGASLWQSYRLLSAQSPLPTIAPSAVAAVSTATATRTPPSLPPTYTSTADPSPTTADPSPTAESSPVPASTDEPIPSPTITSTPFPSPTSRPQSEPTLAMTGTGYMREGEPTPVTPIPSPVPTFEVPAQTTNILLLGSDTPLGSGSTRTDTMMVVAINRNGPTASIMSLPRDLYVYIPGWTMNRLNTALSHGNNRNYPGGGVGLLKQTILYNFGLPIHYYARVDFEGFKKAVDAMDGVDVSVSCRLQDWRLKSPDLDPNDEDNWEQFTLEPGVHHMDGDLALWYARSRLTTNDFDRGRRQQQLLRSMLNQGVDLGLISQIPTLWSVYEDTVETDLDTGRILQLASLAPAIRENGVQHLYLAGKTQSWTVPETGAYVHLPIWEGDGMMRETFLRLFRPPALNRAARPPIQVEIINATDNPDLAVLAADNLAWHGFTPIIGAPEPQENASTHLSYYRPNFKQAYEWLISWILGQRVSQIELVTDENYPYDYRVVLGQDYDPCRPELFAPQPFLNQ